MTNPDPCTNCHYLHDSATKCAERACPFVSQRQEADEDPEPEEEDDVLVWRMRGEHPQRAARGARGAVRPDRARREAGGAT
jgi:hypothetical protein